MIGRAAIGRPWLLEQAAAALAGKPVPVVGLERRFDTMERYVRDTVRYVGENHGCRMLRSRLGWFVKGMPHSSRFRESIKHISSEAEAMDIIQNYQK